MNYIKVILLVVILTAGAVKTFSQQQYTYDFLNLYVDARSASMAGSFVSVENDVNAIFYNPAGLATLKNKQASVGFFKYLLDINSGNAAYSQKYKDIGYFGAGVRYVNYGSFEGFDENSVSTGTFNASDIAFTLSYANIYKDVLKYGVSAKLIHSAYQEYSSSALAFDAGIIYTLPNEFNVGISLLNAGFQIKQYADTRQDLPLDLRVGLNKRLEYLPLTVNIGFEHLTNTYDKFFERFKNIIIGGEFEVNEFVILRLGYNNAQRQNFKTGTSSGIAGFSAGLGVKLEKYKFDYSFSSLGHIGSAHRINLGFSF